MNRRSARRLVLAALPAALAAALVAPGAANATFPILKACEGPSIEGNGATFQGLAQEVWAAPGNKFNEVALEGACEVGKFKAGEPKVKYNPTGSGPGLQSWGVGSGAGTGKFGVKNAYVGTDEPPTRGQIEEIENEGPYGHVENLNTIPVVQGAVAVVIHLPTGCTVEGGTERLKLKPATVESIYRGTTTEWSKLTEKGKNKLSLGCAKKKITRVVREEGSGTTSIFMKFQELSAKGKKRKFGGGPEYTNCKAEKILPPEEEILWKEEAVKSKNIAWPEEKLHPVLRGCKGSGVVAKVVAEEGTIGYANMADARVNAKMVPPEGGAGKPTSWIEMENGLNSLKEPLYADPATNGEVAEKAASNCAETLYTNGRVKFPPASTKAAWNEVTTSVKEPHYPLCGFSYDLGLEKAKGFGKGEAASEESARTAVDYLNFIVHGGQKVIAEKTDYLGLPENAKGKVLKIAQEGVARLSWE